MKIRCPACGGSGIWPGAATVGTAGPPMCKCCDGTGVQVVLDPTVFPCPQLQPAPWVPFPYPPYWTNITWCQGGLSIHNSSTD